MKYLILNIMFSKLIDVDHDYDNDYVDVVIMLMFNDDYVGDFDNGELLATNSYMQLATTLMVCACIEKC